MTPERWQQIDELLQEALDRQSSERLAFVEAACNGDEELRQETISLIRAHQQAGDFIERPLLSQSAPKAIIERQDLAAEDTLGQFRIIEHIATGGMGQIYKAFDEKLARNVALKVFPSKFTLDEGRLQRFQKEARAASLLNHPNILTVYEVGQADDVRFISTEYIPGDTVRDLIATGSLSIEEIIDISIQMATGLLAAHGAGIIHRDIKPENLMRREDHLLKILDFGIAKLAEPDAGESASEAVTQFSARTEVGVVLGTVGYMSPQQARGQAVDLRTDLWSAGCVIYEMIAGRSPFKGATQLDTMVSILERDAPAFFPDLRNIPRELRRLESIVRKLIEKEPSRRYSDFASLLEDLNELKRQIDRLSPVKLARLNQALALSRESQGALAPDATSNVQRRSTTIVDRWPSLLSITHYFELERARGLFLSGALLLLLLAGGTAGYLWTSGRSVKSLFVKQNVAPTASTKPYVEMSEAEKLAFIDRQEQRISSMIGDRAVKLDDDALRAIKYHVDRYVLRVGSSSDEFTHDDIRAVYARATPYLPLIAKSFADRNVPAIVGIYLPVIESEYRPCYTNSIGASGLYQFLPSTAKTYGVAPGEMCDAQKMTPAAAHYIADRMAELGDDSQSMTLVILSYNRGAEWVRKTLKELRDSKNYQRNFWSMYANRDKLDDSFRNESAYYVPAFFAAAIIGENPDVFVLGISPLSVQATRDKN